MELKANSQKSDCIAALYRCAYLMATDRWEIALEFFEKAKNGLEIRLDDCNFEKYNNVYWAEKVLDEYMRIKCSNE